MNDNNPSKNLYRKEIKIITKENLIPKTSKPADKSPNTEGNSTVTNPADKKAENNEMDERVARLIGLKNVSDIKNKSAQLPEDNSIQIKEYSPVTNPAAPKTENSQADEKVSALTDLQNNESKINSAQVTEDKSAETEGSSPVRTSEDIKVKPEISEIDEKVARLIGLKNFNDLTSKNKSTLMATNGRCRVIVSADFMEAYLLIEPPKNGGNWPNVEEALGAIKTEGLAEFDQKAVEDAVERRLITQVLIAKGTPPIHGQDADLNIHYELIDLHKFYIEGLIEDERHRVDYHQVRTINSVEKGDQVAEKTTATTGTDGVDIRGQMVPAVPGKDKEIKLGKNVTWDDDGLKVYATNPGKLLLIKNCLNVLPIHEVDGNVNYSTGNIDFAGNLVVRGDVETGFKVKADGDIIIMGNVDASDITTGGKLSIKGGVFGMDKSKLECSGDFFAKEIERVNLNCRGTVTIREAIMHCQVVAENKVVVEGGKGWIVGGTIQAGESVEANIIGSRLGTTTEVEVYPTYRHLAEAVGYEEQPEPETASGADSLPEASPNLKAVAGYEVQTQVESITRGRIKYKELLYPGVKIKIGPHLFVIRDELSCGTLYCTHEGDLRLIPAK